MSKTYFVPLKIPLSTKKGTHTNNHNNAHDTKRFGPQVQSWCTGRGDDFPLEKPGEDQRSDARAEFGGLGR